MNRIQITELEKEQPNYSSVKMPRLADKHTDISKFLKHFSNLEIICKG